MPGFFLVILLPPAKEPCVWALRKRTGGKLGVPQGSKNRKFG